MKPRKLIITDKDWEAMLILMDAGIGQARLDLAFNSPKDPRYKPYRQFLHLRARIQKQLTGKLTKDRGLKDLSLDSESKIETKVATTS